MGPGMQWTMCPGCLPMMQGMMQQKAEQMQVSQLTPEQMKQMAEMMGAPQPEKK